MAKIMVIDDEEPQRTFLRERLEQLGHEVQCLASADEGMKLLADHKFDLVLSDV